VQKSDCLHVGTLVKLYGYKGGFVLALDEPLGEEIEKWEWIFLDVDGLLVPFFIDTISLTGEITAYVTFDDIISETQARRFLNCELFQKKSLVPKPTTRLETDLLKGYEVIDKKTNRIGKVDEIINYNQNLLIRILNGKKEILVPLADQIIVRINHKKKEIEISAPEGLFDLNE
jgi:16S rRNA processing protein RimM